MPTSVVMVPVGVVVKVIVIVGRGIVVQLSHRVRMLVRVLEFAMAMRMTVAHDSGHGARVPPRPRLPPFRLLGVHSGMSRQPAIPS